MTVPGRGRASTGRHRCRRGRRPDRRACRTRPRPAPCPFSSQSPSRRSASAAVEIDGLAPGDHAREVEPLVAPRRGQAVNQVPDAQPHDVRHRPAAGRVGDVAFGQRSLVRERRAEQREVEYRVLVPHGEARPDVPVPAGDPVRPGGLPLRRRFRPQVGRKLSRRQRVENRSGGGIGDVRSTRAGGWRRLRGEGSGSRRETQERRRDTNSADRTACEAQSTVPRRHRGTEIAKVFLRVSASRWPTPPCLSGRLTFTLGLLEAELTGDLDPAGRHEGVRPQPRRPVRGVVGQRRRSNS